MTYLLIVSHATLANGVTDALAMLLGPRPNVFGCAMEEGMDANAYEASLGKVLGRVNPGDAVVLLADIAGGAPARLGLKALEQACPGAQVLAMGGVNLPMALSAVMAIEDGFDLDSLRDALLVDGAQAVREL